MAGKTKVKVTLHYPAVLRVVTNASENTAKKGAESVQSRAQRYAPFKTGFLREHIVINTLPHGAGPGATGVEITYLVRATADYSGYQEWGTGPIYPRNKKALRWEQNGVIIFAAHTKGVPAVHYMRKAMEMTTVADFT